MTPILLPHESYYQGEAGHSTHPQVLQQKANWKCSQPALLWKSHSPPAKVVHVTPAPVLPSTPNKPASTTPSRPDVCTQEQELERREKSPHSRSSGMDFQLKLDTGIKHIHLLPSNMSFLGFKTLSALQYKIKEFYFPTDFKTLLSLCPGSLRVVSCMCLSAGRTILFGYTHSCPLWIVRHQPGSIVQVFSQKMSIDPFLCT